MLTKICLAGDFFLMAKSCWGELRGYPELPSHSFIDSYMCFMAVSSGLSQIILDKKMRIYHQEHVRSTSTRPLTNYQIFQERRNQMIDQKKPLGLNNKEWGLGNINFKEYII